VTSLAKSVAISVLAGVIPGGASMYVAWQHNPQCEIHCAELGVSWGYWLFIGASWAIPTMVVTFFIARFIASGTRGSSA